MENLSFFIFLIDTVGKICYNKQWIIIPRTQMGETYKYVEEGVFMSKRIRTIILCTVAVIAMFIPTYIAIANYATLGSWQNTLTGDTTVITVKNEDGGIVFSGSGGADDVIEDICTAEYN